MKDETSDLFDWLWGSFLVGIAIGLLALMAALVVFIWSRVLP